MEIQRRVSSRAHDDRIDRGAAPSESGAARIRWRAAAAGRRALLGVMAAIVTLTAALTMTAAPASAAGTATWTGGGANALWTNPLNWQGGVAPRPGDNLIFGGVVPVSIDNFPAGTAFAFNPLRGR